MAKALTTKAGILLSGLIAVGLAALAFPLGAQSAAPQIELVAAAQGAAPEDSRVPAVFDIPMVYNDRVARMLDAYQNRAHDRFEEGLDNAARYEPLIRTTFQAEGLPEDLLYVAMIESSFRPTARSGARAQGIWQFVQSTGHRFGLKSDRLVDERADPAKATLAAARFWKTLYAEYGNWHLAMAAYNAGEGRVSSAIRKTGIDDYWQLCSRNALPRETCNYVPGVIAAGMIAKDPVKYGFERQARRLSGVRHGRGRPADRSSNSRPREQRRARRPSRSQSGASDDPRPGEQDGLSADGSPRLPPRDRIDARGEPASSRLRAPGTAFA